MGLAASQARLLTITARLADNELRSQTINNAKMRLATQSAQASDEYVSALNNSRLMFTNTGADGLSQTVPLTFNSLTQYSQYNNQYGIVNAAGQILVSEEDAKIFEGCHNNLEEFLKAHDLEWDTTFFDESRGPLAEKLTSFYSGDYSYIGSRFLDNDGNPLSNETLKDMYLRSISEETSIEKKNYDKYARDYYQELVNLYNNTIPEFRKDIFGDDDDKDWNAEKVANAIAEWGTNGQNNAIKVIYELLFGSQLRPTSDYCNPTDGTNRNSYALYGQYPSPSGDAEDGVAKYFNTDKNIEYVRDFILGFRDAVYPAGNGQVGGPTAGWVVNNQPVAGGDGPTLEVYDPNTDNTTTIYTESAWTCNGISVYYNVPYATATDSEGRVISYGRKTYITVDNAGQQVGEGQYTGNWFFDSYGHTSGDEHQSPLASSTYPVGSMEWAMDQMSHVYMEVEVPKERGDDTNLYMLKYEIPRKLKDNEESIEDDYNGSMDIIKIYSPDVNNSGAQAYTREERYYYFVMQYFNTLFNAGYFDPAKYAEANEELDALGNYVATRDKFIQEFGFLPHNSEDLVNFDNLMKNLDIETYPEYEDAFNETFMGTIVNSWLVEKMIDVLGAPKYTWVDTKNPDENVDAKAQWLTNLFNRMQYGYKVLENGLAKSSEWLEYAFESGLVSMEQVDLSYNWVNLDYKSCSSITEETDNSTMVAKAEAKYNRAMNDIKQKDSMFDLQLKNIDTEHSSLQAEYDVIKDVMKKNIERTMKFNQSA